MPLPSPAPQAPPSPEVSSQPRRGLKPGILVAVALALAGVVALRLCVGDPMGWPGGDLRGALLRLVGIDLSPSPHATGVLDIRLMRVALGLVVGAALAISGVALQALLHNPLAEPFILGLSSGAGVGVMVQTVLFYYLQKPFGSNHVGALAGSLASMGIVYMASRRRGTLDPLGLLLVGVVLGTINGALIMLLNYLRGPAGLNSDVARWMMGYLNEGIGLGAFRIIVLISMVGLALLLAQSRAMDVAAFSDAEARSLGVNLTGLRTLLFIVSTVLTAGAVVLAGPIAFVGLICPHLARLLLGPGHRRLLIGSALLGAMLIVAADCVIALVDAATLIGRMPIGIFTAMIGGPAFLWMLRPQLGRGVE